MLHVNLHLERMADYCVTVAKLTKLVRRQALASARIVAALAEMGVRAEEMTRVALRSFQHRDLARAEALVDLDELIDRTNRRLLERVLELDAEHREWGLRMLVVSRCLERIGDHAVDIGEQTAYLVTGEFREFTDASHPEELRVASSLVLAVLPAAAAQGPSPRRRQPVVRFAFAGDIAMVAGPGRARTSGRCSRDLSGDVVSGNLEGTLTDRGSSKCGARGTDCFSFRAPPSYAPLLRRAGFTVHEPREQPRAGLRRGRSARHRRRRPQGAGLLTTGRPGEIAYTKVRGTRVAVLGFAPYRWAQSLLDLPAAEALVRKADRWADLVVVTMHAGAEGADHQHVEPGNESFLGENRGNAVAFAHVGRPNAGADLVVGSGPHVLRGMEWYRGRLIAYSLGNFVGTTRSPPRA